jgi:hypothetical protein
LIPLYNNRAAARLKTGEYRGVVDDCNAVQSLDSRDLKSLLRRATAWEALEKWEDAKGDYEMLMSVDPSMKGVSLGLARVRKALNGPHDNGVSSNESGNVKNSTVAMTGTQSLMDEFGSLNVSASSDTFSNPGVSK